MKNNKGFMLAEVVITSTIIITTLVGLFASFNKIYNGYRVKNSYFDINGVYALKEMINHLMSTDGDNNINVLFSKIKVDNPNNPDNNPNNSRVVIVEKGAATATFSNDNYITDPNKNDQGEGISFINFYNVNNLAILDFSVEAINHYKQSYFNKTFTDYLEYLKGYYSFSNKSNIPTYKYLFVMEYGCDGNNNNCKYSNIGVMGVK